MKKWAIFTFVLLAFSFFSYTQAQPDCCGEVSAVNRADFPAGFVFGVASSAFQYEGAVKEGGKGPTVWDVISHIPGKILDGSNADIAEDQYHRYKEDIKLMKDLGVDAYRFSISWSRIYPNGRGHRINEEGIAHYNDLIDTLLEYGIMPYVTLSHMDLPQALEDSYGGWLSPNIVDDFVEYASTCFRAFGDRVKHWITFNEPHLYTIGAYTVGLFPPEHCSLDSGTCKLGNSAIETYLVGHHFLLSHAAAVDVYRTNYTLQGGQVGITLDTRWFEPLTPKITDRQAAIRALDFELGWFMHPLVFGEYPPSMNRIVDDRLPTFTKHQSSIVKGSVDFFGINHYTSMYASEVGPDSHPALGDFSQVGYYKDTRVNLTGVRPNGEKIGMEVNTQYVVPWGIKRLLKYIRNRYNNPMIVITENGVSDRRVLPNSISSRLNDKVRIDYLRSYLSCLLTSIKEGSNVNAYFVWSLLDNWEWGYGYDVKYGLYNVDRQNNLKRTPKDSALWYHKFLSLTKTMGHAESR